MRHSSFLTIHPESFEKEALIRFKQHYELLPIYRKYAQLLSRTPENVRSLQEIPFLPISFFKSHQILHQNLSAKGYFASSGTTGQLSRSKHYFESLTDYELSFTTFFEKNYGPIEELRLLALLPSYKEQQHSSLIYMIDSLLKRALPGSGYFKDDYASLTAALQEPGKKLLIGVTYALLDFAETKAMPLADTIIMETGGMKGRRKELVRAEVHEVLTNAFGVDHIHSEYGMTELFSQAYAAKDGIFTPAPWMRVLIRETEDPLSYVPEGRTGGINIIDLANTQSCSFIATEDLGKVYADGTFEVLGRFDTAEVRGCNLLMA